jgi:hypothetical protein
VLRGMQNDQHGAPVAVIAQAPPSAEDAFAVLPQNLTIAIQMHAAHRTRWAPGHTWLPNFISADQPTRRHAPGGPSAPVLRRGIEERAKRHATGGTHWMDRCGQRHLRRLQITLREMLPFNPECHRCRQSGKSPSLPTDSPGVGTHPPVRLLALRVRALHPARPRSGRARS